MSLWQRTVRRLGWMGAIALTGCETIAPFLPQLPEPKPPQVQEQSATTAQIETQIYQGINQERQKQGLQPLKQNSALAKVARDYSKQMATQNFFRHTSPTGTSASQRVRSAQIFYSMLGENLFRSVNAPDPAPLAVKGWMESPGHRANILTPEFRETGIGVWRQGSTYYATQLFLRQ